MEEKKGGQSMSLEERLRMEVKLLGERDISRLKDEQEERLRMEAQLEEERDIWRLKEKLDDFLDFYYEFAHKHGGLREWAHITNVLDWNTEWPWHELEPIPEEEE